MLWTLFLWIFSVSFTCALTIHAPILSLQLPHYVSTPADTLQSLAQDCTTLGVSYFDVYGDFEGNGTSSYLRQFEHEVAHEFDKQDAVFIISGVMAQNIALRIHGGKHKYRFVCHESSHLLLHEQEAYQHLMHMDPIVIYTRQSNDLFHSRPMEIKDVTSALLEQHVNTVGTLLLELPHRELGGTCTPWEDILQMRDYCHSHGIKFHCDGARIFEATAGYDNKSLKELAEPFDSIYISFYKGLGGLSGAMLLGTSEFCNDVRVWLRRSGGNLYTLLPYAVSGWSGYRTNWVNAKITFAKKQQKLARVIQLLSSNEKIHSCVSFHPPVPQVNMIHGFLCYSRQDCMDALDSVEKVHDIRVLSRIRDVEESEPAYKNGFRCKFELSIGNANGAIDDDVYLKGWDAFASALVARNSKGL